MPQPVEIPEALIDALAERVAERLEERSRWAEIDGVAEHLGCSVRRVRDLRERGMPAKRIGRRLIFDLRAVDEWLERQ
jgi:excisionase family DNA binding protein